MHMHMHMYIHMHVCVCVCVCVCVSVTPVLAARAFATSAPTPAMLNFSALAPSGAGGSLSAGVISNPNTSTGCFITSMKAPLLSFQAANSPEPSTGSNFCLLPADGTMTLTLPSLTRSRLPLLVSSAIA